MKPILLLLLFFCGYCGLAQPDKIPVEKQTAVRFEADTFVGNDGFGNLFYIKNNVFFKLGPAGLLQYRNIALGNIKMVDVLNPLKIVVFYESFNTVVLLDSQLNEIRQVNFSKNQEPLIASAVGVAGQNQLWVYNSLTQQPGLYDLSQDQYKNLGVPISEAPVLSQTDFNYFYWIDKLGQWFSCSIFGRVEKLGSLASFKQIFIIDQNYLLYAQEPVLYLYNRNTGRQEPIAIVEKSFEKMYYKDQILSIFTPGGITNYKLILP